MQQGAEVDNLDSNSEAAHHSASASTMWSLTATAAAARLPSGTCNLVTFNGSGQARWTNHCSKAEIDGADSNTNWSTASIADTQGTCKPRPLYSNCPLQRSWSWIFHFANLCRYNFNSSGLKFSSSFQTSKKLDLTGEKKIDSSNQSKINIWYVYFSWTHQTICCNDIKSICWTKTSV